MEDKYSVINAFFSEKLDYGECKNDEFEFGNTHRSIIKCSFCVLGKCHYNGYCERRMNEHSGWDSN